MNVFRLYFSYAGYIACICRNILMCIVVIIVFLITANLLNKIEYEQYKMSMT